jgi:hypothetical protein
MHTGNAALNALTTEFTYNMLGPVMWITAVVTGLVGLVIVISPNSKSRVALLNLFLVLLFVHFVVSVVYGCILTNAFRQLYLIHVDLWTALIDGTVAPAIGKLTGSSNVEERIGEGTPVFEAFEQASAGVIFSLSPYPLNFIFYLGMRIDLAAFIFVIFPGIFMILSFPFVLAIRRYFASTKSGVVKHRVHYNNTPLLKYMCNGPPSNEGKGYDEMDSEVDEEDLASTFDGDYSGMENDYEESDFDSEESGSSDYSEESQRQVPAAKVR